MNANLELGLEIKTNFKSEDISTIIDHKQPI